MSVTEYIDKFI
jgi:hypothetical protein